MLSVKVSERLDAPAERVWELVRDFGGVQRYAAGIEKCTLEGSGIGAVRTLALAGGPTLQERLEALDDAGRRLSYSIVSGPIPVADYLATVAISDEANGCRIDWSSTFEPKGISEDQARRMIEGVYRGGIAGIKRELGA
jgi:carbon monoxide dehydrogenase subunit G